ncbi:cytochrome-c oxidase, cbb3-type subunit III [Erythrobacter sp. F6033]|uniref:cytochrome-c oxidase, cbb3-type subunit III n=1 Tax=Erythrobacter sp. F6033 TaxID=2926401 RepID=UPI001FF34D3C|nr:cytochrome-c oxidase, cbb3-type subunit III [Erythrobacter sp. F6033]MCK0127564.1 cytochrome-c oxidase, cbb3-type subunit III [Erythrobacter sp. F6033]
MADKNRVDEPTGTELVGHEWDGIEELNTPLPRWWLWTFYATIAWSVVYVVLYPAWPMVSQATEGVLGWSSRGALADEMTAADMARVSTFERIAVTDITKLSADPELMGQAIAGGAAAFKQHCVQCHGAGAAGYEEYGYPNLNDDDWIWGGEIGDIEYTLTHGIRWEGSDQTRISYMPAFEGIFEREQVDALVGHVLSLSGNGSSNAVGAELYAANCVACHQASGEGDQLQGAPALNDAIWLYGNSEASIRQQILAPRHGAMPGWSDKLDPVTIRMLAAYVHSRGGGEDTAQDAPIAETSEQEAAQQEVSGAEGDDRL